MGICKMSTLAQSEPLISMVWQALLWEAVEHRKHRCLVPIPAGLYHEVHRLALVHYCVVLQFKNLTLGTKALRPQSFSIKCFSSMKLTASLPVSHYKDALAKRLEMID